MTAMGFANKQIDDLKAKLEALATAVMRFEGVGHVTGCALEMAELACDADDDTRCNEDHPPCDCGWAELDAILQTFTTPANGEPCVCIYAAGIEQKFGTCALCNGTGKKL